MSRFEMKFNEWSEHAEHDWLVFDRGVMVAGFAGSNAAERFIAIEEANERAIRSFKAERSALAVSKAEDRRRAALRRKFDQCD